MKFGFSPDLFSLAFTKGISIQIIVIVVFPHAKVYAILACIFENLRMNYQFKQFHILSDIQAALKALYKISQFNIIVSSYNITLQDCGKNFEILTLNNLINLSWVLSRSYWNREMRSHHSSDEWAELFNAQNQLQEFQIKTVIGKYLRMAEYPREGLQ